VQVINADSQHTYLIHRVVQSSDILIQVAELLVCLFSLCSTMALVAAFYGKEKKTPRVSTRRQSHPTHSVAAKRGNDITERTSRLSLTRGRWAQEEGATRAGGLLQIISAPHSCPQISLLTTQVLS